jgi:hypothetical protein
MRKLLPGVFVALLAFGIGGYFFWSMGKTSFWESSIHRFEEEDRVHPPKSGAIVFVGSSSIRFWNTLAEDMAPLDVVRRGFGGSQIAHVNYYARRIVLPYKPRAVVLYAGDNDLSWPWSKSSEEVANDFKKFVAIVHGELPETWIYYVSIKPCPSRWGNWAKAQQTNSLISEYIRGQERAQFIDATAVLLNAQGRPRRELFRWDGLHLNAQGYAVWTTVIKPVLLQRFAAEENPTRTTD